MHESYPNTYLFSIELLRLVIHAPACRVLQGSTLVVVWVMS